MAKKIIRVVSRSGDGEFRTRDYEDFSELTQRHEQIGLDDCSTDLSLRGLPLFRGLIGPMSDSKQVVVYESPDVFEFMTKEWSQRKIKRKRRTREELEMSRHEVTDKQTHSVVPFPKFTLPNSNHLNPTVNH